jgi:hypothetical protein
MGSRNSLTVSGGRNGKCMKTASESQNCTLSEGHIGLG